MVLAGDGGRGPADRHPRTGPRGLAHAARFPPRGEAVPGEQTPGTPGGPAAVRAGHGGHQHGWALLGWAWQNWASDKHYLSV